MTIRDELVRRHVSVKPPQCASLITDLLQFYWEDRRQAEDFARQQVLWYEVLKHHSGKTIQTATMDWIRTETRKPMPADILKLCDDTDDTPFLLTRLAQFAKLPVEEKLSDEPEEERTMHGCPIVLARIIGFARNGNIEFSIDEQMEYLRTGETPKFFIKQPPISEADIRELDDDAELIGPSKQELLAQMSPAERAAATTKEKQ